MSLKYFKTYLIGINNEDEIEVVFVEHLFDAMPCATFFAHTWVNKQARVKCIVL